MREYQEIYLENTKKVMELMKHTGLQGITDSELRQRLLEKSGEIRKIRRENTQILRINLIPMLDDILSVDEEDIASLEEFTDELQKEQLDAGIRYQVCSALVTYARMKKKRNLLIKELYMTGMALYSLQILADEKHAGRFQWKMRLVFGEAAGYIRYYDEIEDVETRGYIHRSMGNMALGQFSDEKKTAERKLEIIRRSLQVLTDPVYHEKTPELPWDVYIYKTHQERTSVLSYLRKGSASVSDIREVMESAQYVYERQRKLALKNNRQPSIRWIYAYHAAEYHCGVNTLPELLQNLEQLYASVSPGDYGLDGIYGNLYLPTVYSDYVAKDEEMAERKKPVVLMMYRRQLEYLKHAPVDKNLDKLFFYVRSTLDSYLEYPGENNFREYIEEAIEGRQPETHVHSLAVAELSKILLEELLCSNAEFLLGVLDINNVEELRERKEELLEFLYHGSLLHDIGKLKMLDLYEVPNRSWVAEEEELHSIHPFFGYEILNRCPSTQTFAPAALGHHRWFDEKGGYPEEYRREENRNAALVDIIAVANFMDQSCSPVGIYQEDILSFEEMLHQLKTSRGTRFAPAVVDAVLSREKEIREREITETEGTY